MPISPGNNVVLNWSNAGIKPAITVAPGTSDTSSSSIELIGQGFPGWAVPLQENLLHILENFASNGAPVNPTKGQLWWDTSGSPEGKLYVCVDPTALNAWREVISYPDIYINVNAPDPAAVGYIWYNPLTFELKLCTAPTIVSPPTAATWTAIITFQSIISDAAPPFPREDGQLWYDSLNRVLYSWDDAGAFWQRVGPNKDIDVIGGSGWNEIIVWLNKILSTPTNTLDNADPFTENNTWGYNQSLPFGPYYSDVPSDEWMRLYDVILNLGTFLGIPNTSLIKQDFHLPGAFTNQYGIPFMLTQWDLLLDRVEQFKTGHLNVPEQSLQNSNAIMSFTGTTNAGTITLVTSPNASGFAIAETWTLVATSATNFTVTGSVNGAQAAATVGTPYANAFIEFTIDAGVNPFVANDTFVISVLPNLKDTYSSNWGAADSGINTTFQLAFADINHQRGFFNAGGKVKFTTTFDDVTAGHNLFWNEFLTAIDNITVDLKSTSWGDPVVTIDPANLGYYDLTTSWQTILYVDARILPSGATRSVGYQPTFAAGTVTPGVSNVGNGTVGAITGIDQDPLTSVSEVWTLTATSATTFGVNGSTSGAMADITVGTPYTNAYFALTITAGGTPFDVNDTFTFEISGVSNYVKVESKIDVNPNNILFKITLNDTTTVAVDNVTTGDVVVQLDMLRGSPVYLDNPVIDFPDVTVTAWAP